MFFLLLIFAGSAQVFYNCGMTDRNKVCRIVLYLFVFLTGFLVFDSLTVVASVLFAVAALDFFLSRADQKAGR